VGFESGRFVPDTVTRGERSRKVRLRGEFEEKTMKAENAGYRYLRDTGEFWGAEDSPQHPMSSVLRGVKGELGT
jgi:hypothetical protein